MATKVLVVNGSPHMDRGSTGLVLCSFVEGMKAAGADVEIVYTKRMQINACCGDFYCWYKTDGQCRQKDDMQGLYPKIREADIWVWATPLYADGMSGSLKMFIDRLIPLLDSKIEMVSGHCRHPLRNGIKRGKVVLVSVCGFWEKDNFDPLVKHVQHICKNAGREYAGSLLRPHAPLLLDIPREGALERLLDTDDILTAAKSLGCELIETGEMSVENLEIVSRNIISLPVFKRLVNSAYFFRKIGLIK